MRGANLVVGAGMRRPTQAIRCRGANPSTSVTRLFESRPGAVGVGLASGGGRSGWPCWAGERAPTTREGRTLGIRAALSAVAPSIAEPPHWGMKITTPR